VPRERSRASFLIWDEARAAFTDRCQFYGSGACTASSNGPDLV